MPSSRRCGSVGSATVCDTDLGLTTPAPRRIFEGVGRKGISTGATSGAVHRQFGTGKSARIRTAVCGQPWTGGPPESAPNVLDYVDYVKSDAVALLQREVGWRSYGGKHHESVYTRWYQGWFLPTRFGYDKRKVHLSSLICSGELTREQALRELRQPPYAEDLQRADTEYVSKKLGLDAAAFAHTVGPQAVVC